MRTLATTLLALMLALTTATGVLAFSPAASATAPAPTTAASAPAADPTPTVTLRPSKRAAKKFARTWHQAANAKRWRWVRKHSTKRAFSAYRNNDKWLRDMGYGRLKFGKKALCEVSVRDYGYSGQWLCWTTRSAPAEITFQRRNGRWKALDFYFYD